MNLQRSLTLYRMFVKSLWNKLIYDLIREIVIGVLFIRPSFAIFVYLSRLYKCEAR